MKFVFALLLSFWLFQLPLLAQKQPEKATYTIYNNQILERQEHDILLTEGDSVILLLTRHVGGDVRNDQGYFEEIWFSLPVLEKEFTWNAAKASGYFIRKCRCVDAGINEITEGQIEGHRTGKHWTINVDITAQGRDTGEDYSISLKVVCPSK